MNINRHNYEEFFILYVDNELSAADKQAVEVFIQENPDLKEELVMLQQTKLIPDSTVTFDYKETLLKAQVNSPVNLNNYEEWLVLYADNELTGEEKEAVEKFVLPHPSIQKELELFQKTRLEPDEKIVFPGKESLYRREEKVKVVTIKWWRIAAAAVFLIGFSAVGFMLFNQKTTDNNGSVAVIPSAKPNVPSSANSNTNTSTDILLGEQNAPDINNNSLAAETKADRQSLTGNNDDNNRNIAMQVSSAKTKEAPVTTTVVSSEVKETNNLPVPAFNESNAAGNTEIAATTPKKNDLIISEENKQPAVTLPADPALNFAKASASNEDVADADQSDKKGSVRGFLRRITRTIEKTTNVKATDDDDRLLVGGLAIKL